MRRAVSEKLLALFGDGSEVLAVRYMCLLVYSVWYRFAVSPSLCPGGQRGYFNGRTPRVDDLRFVRAFFVEFCA